MAAIANRTLTRADILFRRFQEVRARYHEAKLGNTIGLVDPKLETTQLHRETVRLCDELTELFDAYCGASEDFYKSVQSTTVQDAAG